MGVGKNKKKILLKSTSECDSYVHYLNCGEGFKGTHTSKLIKLNNLNIYSDFIAFMPQILL